MTVTTRPKFDRRATTPPKYLARLRNKGWWRMLDYVQHDLGKDSVYYRSSAFKECYEDRGVFLDAGCGDSADALIARYAGFDKAYKVDLFPPFFDSWQNLWGENFRQHEAKQWVELIQSDICEELPIAAGSVDFIGCSAMIDLIPDDDRVLWYKEAYRLLKPGGKLSVYVVLLVNGYHTDTFIEHDKCTMPGWGIGFEPYSRTGSIFVVRKPA
jgi:SAM-dependent methyltransferase